MYLKKLAIVNYRSCQKVILNFESDQPNTLIGKADAGKSSILRAIELLLNEKSYPDLLREGFQTSDISNNSATQTDLDEILSNLDLPPIGFQMNESIIVIGVFSKEDGDFLEDFDDVASNQLKWFAENLEDDEIPILRIFNSNHQKGQYYLKCLEDSSEKKELWNQNKPLLRSLARELNVTDEEIKNVNQAGSYKNIELFRAIYNKINTAFTWSEYDDFAKKDRKFFPVYRYIDWREITLDIVEQMASDAMSSVIEPYKNDLTEQAQILARQATDDVNEEIERRITDVISDLKVISSIKAKVVFESGGKVSDISVLKNTSDGEVSLDSQGDGIKKQIGFAFMRLGAEEGGEKELSSKRYLWGFDEPESHLYPPEKRAFYEIIKDLSSGVFQTFISTHSSIFVDKSKLSDIYQVQLENMYTKVTTCDSVDDVHKSLGIKNSDFLFYDTFIAVEDESDRRYISHFYQLYFDKSIEDDSVQFIMLGGATQRSNSKRLFEQMLDDFSDPNDNVYYVLDRDTNSGIASVFLVGAYDIEDSIGDNFWISLVEDSCGVNLTPQDMQDIRDNLGPGREEKFHYLLGKRVAGDPSRTDYLPGKTDCAGLMAGYVDSSSGIPNDLVTFFQHLESKS